MFILLSIDKWNIYKETNGRYYFDFVLSQFVVIIIIILMIIIVLRNKVLKQIITFYISNAPINVPNPLS